MIGAALAAKILLIENDPAIAETIRKALATSTAGTFGLEWVHQLSEGLERLSCRGISAILLDLRLPDSNGMQTFDKVFKVAQDIPILILGVNHEEELARQAVGRGAQDYLPPAHLDNFSLPRWLRSAIERKVVEDALYVERERALVTLNSIGDAVLCADISGDITYLNLVAETMTGWGREEATGRPLAEVFRIIDGPTRKTARDPMEMAVEQNKTVGLTVNCVLIRGDRFESAIEDSAAPNHDRVGRVIGAVIVFHDVSAARAMSVQMTHAAQHDLVTNLPNRLLLNDRISRSIALARRQKKPMAVLFLDLDHFRYVNDSLGHAAGDQLLQSVSKRLVASLRDSDTVSRQGGDEFIILLSEVSHPEDAASSARKILRALGAAHTIKDQDLHINASIGISMFPEDGEEADTLIQNADMAMYHAKESGRNNFQFFTPAMNLQSVERQALEGNLRHALEREEFLLHYQPKVNLETGAITGVEALIRWAQPDHEVMLPGQFVHIAEDCGLINDIGRWVLREACRQGRAWQDLGLPPLTVSVNVSASELREKNFVEGVRGVLAETGLAARYLELELTEGVLMEDAPSTVSTLQALKTMGVQLAVDDFGTGYSSPSYLRQFPIDVVKIDQSFVQELTADPDGSAIVTAIIDMGRSLRHLVIAEGIETQEQKENLQARRCAEGQGYLFSRPVAAKQFAQLLRTGIAEKLLD
jgi:diguanylate cyclase (GGDEF)-like protein/PAS domain S-box-containing protein